MAYQIKIMKANADLLTVPVRSASQVSALETKPFGAKPGVETMSTRPASSSGPEHHAPPKAPFAASTGLCRPSYSQLHQESKEKERKNPQVS